jgi:hypothetical protein
LKAGQSWDHDLKFYAGERFFSLENIQTRSEVHTNPYTGVNGAPPLGYTAARVTS